MPELVGIGEEFLAETDREELTYDPELVASVMLDMIMREPHVVLVCEIDDRMAGLISFSVRRLYSREPAAYQYMFYVLPEYRGRTVAGSALLNQALRRAHSMGAVRFYGTNGAHVDPEAEQRLANLYKNSGFSDYATCFVRELDQEDVRDE